MKHKDDSVDQALYRHAKERIPGGTQLLSKRPEMFAPDVWPAYYRKARGCEVWDLDGRHLIDMSTSGIGACLLGMADPEVTKAVIRAVNLGSMSSLNPPEEVELADELCRIHPWAENVRFARCGGEIAAVAVRIARATTDRSVVALSGYHGWHDWYLAANLGESDALRGVHLAGLDPRGVPSELRNTTLTFRADDFDGFKQIVDQYGDKLAAVVMEPCRFRDPAPGFLEYIREETRKLGAVLIFDEITVAWRTAYGGSHLNFGVTPDMAIFSKALGNGHPIAAVVGTRDAMTGAHTSFISSTYWTERVGPVAALATLKRFGETDVPAYAAKIGTLIKQAWIASAERHGLPVEVDEKDYPCLAHFAFDHPQGNNLRTLFTQLMLDKGFLAGTAVYPTLAHNDEIVGLYASAVDDVFAQLARALEEDRVVENLRSAPAHTGFSRLN